MTQGKKYNFNSLLNEYKILIPQIQRDYVQGRNSLRLNENRSKFIKDLVDVVIHKDKSTTLNFIYGYMETRNSNSCFVPIDGQQRLTTLLLLETFIAAKKDEDLDRIKKNFIYETRFTTGRFLNKLFENIKNLVKEGKIDESIRNQNWYSSTWDNDLSIKSCLTILREIQTAFSEGVNFTEYNTDRITFMLLEIKDLGRPNELYIKMNARGKQLTDFENLKAELYGYIEEENIKNNLGENFIADFKQKMDGEWIEFIWDLFDDYVKAESYADVFYKDLLHWVFSTRLMLQKKEIIYLIYPDNNDNIAFYSLSKYLENGEIYECLKDFNALLDLLVWIRKDENEKFIKEYNFSYETFFGDLIGKTLSTYPSRTLLFAIIRYAIVKEKPYDEEFFKYYRVIKNVINNTPIDNAERFFNACNTLKEYDCDLNNLQSIKGGFTERQINEEKEKLNLINNVNNGKNWLQAIVNAESHNYFKGEINFALKLANEDLGEFCDVWENIEIIFPETDRDEGWYNMLHRLLLCYGDYSKDVSNGNRIYTLYYNDNKHNNEDWRGFLREDNGFNLFKECLEEFKNSGYSDFENFAKDKIKDVKQDVGDFRYCLIKYPGLFEVMKSYSRYWKDGKGRILLLWSSKRTQYVEYKTYVIYLRLKEELEKNFKEEEINKKLIYHWGEGNDETNDKSKAWLELSNNGKPVSVCFYRKEFYIDANPIGTATLEYVYNQLLDKI